jgi:hypothetical protein
MALSLSVAAVEQASAEAVVEHPIARGQAHQLGIDTQRFGIGFSSKSASAFARTC